MLACARIDMQFTWLPISAKPEAPSGRKRSAISPRPRKWSPAAPTARASYRVEQREGLEAAYEVNAYPTRQDREELAEVLSISPRRVQVWFQNKRCRATGRQPQRSRPASSPEPEDDVESPSPSFSAFLPVATEEPPEQERTVEESDFPIYDLE